MPRNVACHAVGPNIGTDPQVKKTIPSVSPTQVSARSQSMSRVR